MTPAPESILITDDPDLARDVDTAVDAQLKSLPRVRVAEASWRDFGVVIVVGGLAEAVPLVNTIAPEHLRFASANAEDLASRIRNAGAIFLGRARPRRSATMSAVRSMCRRPRVRPASPPGSGCRIS